MVKYAYGIACGMAYLHHEIFPYLVHGDLAARNVLIGPNYGVKVGDFGTGDLTNYSDCYMASFIPGVRNIYLKVNYM
jgi:serine/threonine protein kinase